MLKNILNNPRNKLIMNIFLPFIVVILAVLPVTGFVKDDRLKHLLQAAAALLLLFGYIVRLFNRKPSK